MKRNLVVIATISIILAGGVIVAIYFGNYNRLPSTNNGANATESNASSSLELKLQATSALDSSRTLIGPISANQPFKIHVPVFVQANFSNPNVNSRDYLIASEIRGPNGTSALSYVQATIGGSGVLSVEVYWKPEQVGDHDLLVFEMPLEKLGRGPVISPVAHVPLKVIE